MKADALAVPSRWQVTPMGHLMDAIKDGTHGSFQRVDAGRPLLSAKNVLDGRIQISDAESQISDEDFASITANGFPAKGDLLMTIVGSIGRSCVYNLEEPHAFQRSVCFIRLDERCYPQYFEYVSQHEGFQKELQLRAKVSAQAGVYMGDIKRIPVPLPPLDEQLDIAAYLNAETARIDRLIDAKRKLLDSLVELKSVRITEILTGVAEDVVPTGDMWIPRIPRNWTLKRLKHLGQVRSGLAKGKKHDTGTETRELPYMRVANVQDGYIDLSDVATLEVATDDVGRYSLVFGDVLMNEGGDYDKLGRGAVWEEKISPCLHQNHVFAVRLDDPAWAPWVSALTRTAYAKFYFMNNSKQSTNLASISQSNVKEWPVVLPPEDIRDQLLNQMSVELKRSDDLIEHVELELAVLEEFRSATITDAVLGRIDVREHMKN
ncbi:restriction endonuclease subunit S [Comamonas antarctica]|uniref:restriction endonuclease subunit S n=1 Tax=Comamonas antarctica TaxID=2743470 RepID=UPI0028E8B4CE|nr:restriction endonuclease subunit S [Comamonas antarctica]